MDEISQKVDQIVGRAPNWSFEYDMSLLELMQMISENLEQHAKTTTDSMQALGASVERAGIALDNTANSLTALQFGQQFVESRCHDDDETAAVDDNNEELRETSAPLLSNEETLKAFLRNNLEMLENCHEKYAIDLQDSDDEDEQSSNTCIFQAKNPYNDRLLPHIYNSNLWKEQWHVGLSEDASHEYSGDEASLVYSDSSSTSISAAADNESYESNTGQLSAWTSSASLPQVQQPLPVAVKAARDNIKISKNAAGSDSNSSNEAMATSQQKTRAVPTPVKKTQQQMPQHEYDLFAELRTTPPPIATPTPPTDTPTPLHSSSTSIKQSASISSEASSRNSATVGLQREPELPNEPTVQPSAAAQSAIKRKPVNLFDDDDFNTFMSEIVDKAQAKAENKLDANKTTSQPQAQPVAKPRSQNKVVVDLFADEPPPFEKPAVVEAFKKAEPVSQKAVNLFDDFEEDNEDLMTPAAGIITKKETVPAKTETTNKIAGKSLFDDDDDDALPKTSTKPLTSTEIKAKSLFDDEEEDDDFLNVFSSQRKQAATTKPTTALLTKTNLFDDDDDDDLTSFLSTKLKSEVEKPKTLSEPRKTLFAAAINEKENDIFGEPANRMEAKAQIAGENKPESRKKPVDSAPSSFPKASLFADDNDDDSSALFSTKPSSSHQAAAKPTHEDDLFTNNFSKEAKNLVEPKKTVDVDLFEDKPIEKDTVHSPVPTSSISKSLPKLKLFDDEDDVEDDLFGGAKKNIARKYAAEDNPEEVKDSIAKKEIKQIEPSAESMPNTIGSVQSQQTNPPLSLFQDDVPEDDGDIFASKVDTVTTPRPEVSASRKPELFQNETGSEENLRTDNVFANANTVKDDFAAEEMATDDLIQTENSAMEVLEVKGKPKEKPEVILEPEDLSIPNSPTVLSEETTDITNEANPPEPETNKAEQKETEPKSPEPDSPEPDSPEPDSPEPNKTVDPPLPTAPSNYSNLFLDEPPDDHDFLESLNAATKVQVTRIYDDDFYEPTLPDLPEAKPANQSTQSTFESPAASVPAESLSDYKGIRLFSDLPPDDEYEDLSSADNQQPSSNSDSKRLHSIFYDDFSETMAAVKQQNSKAPAIPTAHHSFFDDEPPSDDDLFGSIITSSSKKIQEQPKPRKLPESLDEPDKASKKPELHSNIAALQAKIKQQESSPPVSATNDAKPTSSVNKLKIQNLNINVKALLPGAGIKTSQRKSTESVSAEEPSKPQSSPTKSPPTTAVAADTGSPTILQNVCKTRVRAPANRRPSTRQARQENYRKSLLIEEDEKDMDNIIPEEQIKSSKKSIERESQSSEADAIITPTVVAATPTLSQSAGISHFDDIADVQQSKNSLPSQARLSEPSAISQKLEPEQIKPKATQPLTTVAKPSASVAAFPKLALPKSAGVSLFADSDDDDDDLFEKPSQVVKTNAPTAAPKRPPDAEVQAAKAAPKKTILFASDSSESDSDLFKSGSVNSLKPQAKVEPAKTQSNVEPAKGSVKTVPTKQKSLFSSSSSSDDEAERSAKSSKSKQPLAKSLTKPPPRAAGGASGGLFSDDDDGDDLFASSTSAKVKGSTSASTVAKQISQPKSMQQNLPTKEPAASSIKSKDVAKDNNPLADLLQ